MNVVFLINEYSLHNHIITSYLAERPDDKVSILKVPLVVKGKSRVETGKKILPQLSSRFVAEKFVEFLVLGAITWTPKLLPRGAVFRRLRWIAGTHRLPYLEAASIMSPESLDFIRAARPDVIVTLMHQIVKGELLTLASKGIVNIHPGLLPAFRGIQPYFWALSEGAGRTGVTLHLIEDDGVDTGGVLASASFSVPPKSSVSLVYYLTARCAASVLGETLSLMEEGRLTAKAQSPDEGSYYRWPDSAAFSRLWKNGHTLLRISDILSVINGKYDGFEPEQKSFSISQAPE